MKLKVYIHQPYYCERCGAELKLQKSNGWFARLWGAGPGKIQYQCQTTGCPNVGVRFSPPLVEVEAVAPEKVEE